MNHNTQISHTIIDTLYKSGVKDICISPGARNSPIIQACSNSDIKMHSILDERSAGFYALGISKKNKRPVALSCTSGTALGNLFPAIIEARMAEIPLIIITSDRPEGDIDKGENQTIYQDDIYGKYVADFENINPLTDDLDSVANKINKIYNASVGLKQNQKISEKGPVHINVHFDEPLLDSNSKLDLTEINIKPINPLANDIDSFKIDRTIKRPIIICGQSNLKEQKEYIFKISDKIGAPILSDISSNIISNNNVISFYEHFIDTIEVPDLILRFGKKPLSKKLLLLLNQNKDITYLVRMRKLFNDDVNHVIKTSIKNFSNSIDNYIHYEKKTSWINSFTEKDQLVRKQIESLSKDSAINEYSFASQIINKIPDNSNLFIGNSLMIRAFDSFTKRTEKNIHIFSNRGASGIDGNIATALGIAKASNKNNYLILGDQSFMHDVGTLQILAESNIRVTIFIINNAGGAIFDQLPLSNKMNLSAFNQFIRRNHKQHFEGIAQAYDIDYDLLTDIKQLSKISNNKSKIYEVLVDSKNSLEFINQFSSRK